MNPFDIAVCWSKQGRKQWSSFKIPPLVRWVAASSWKPVFLFYLRYSPRRPV